MTTITQSEFTYGICLEMMTTQKLETNYTQEATPFLFATMSQILHRFWYLDINCIR